MKSTFLSLLLAFAALSLYSQDISPYGDNDRDVLLTALHAVSEQDITDWMHVMISPEMRGRLAGDIGYDLLDVLEANNDRWVHRPFMTRSSPWQPPIRPRTDGMVFYMEKIPAITFGTRGTPTRALYHVPEDNMEQIEVEIMRDVIKLLTMSVIEFGNE